MIPVIGLLIILLLALCITRIATEALVLTGLSRTVARFQARSAYTGAGFTTSESESITCHHTRRQIVRWLMLTGHIGFVTVIGSVMLSFSDKVGPDHWIHWVVLAGGIIILIWLTFSKGVERWMARAISWMLTRFANIQTIDYTHLMHISENYGVSAVALTSESPLAGKTVSDFRQMDAGCVLLGVENPNGDYNGAPHAATDLNATDVLILYGPLENIKTFRESLSKPQTPEEKSEDAPEDNTPTPESTNE